MTLLLLVLLLATATAAGAAVTVASRPGAWRGSVATPTPRPTDTYLPVPIHRSSQPPSTDSSPLTLIGLGDSVTAASQCGCAGFVATYAQLLRAETGQAVRALNYGLGGQTSAGLLGTLQRGGPVARAVAQADVVTITIGANDFNPSLVTSGQCTAEEGVSCYSGQEAAMADNLAAIVARVRALRAGQPTTIEVTGYWNVWKDGAVGRAMGPTYVQVSDALTRSANALIADVAARESVTYVDLYTPFKGPNGTQDDTDLLAPDGDHPDARGHDLIADVLAEAAPAAGRV